jgi:hypothetical protein
LRLISVEDDSDVIVRCDVFDESEIGMECRLAHGAAAVPLEVAGVDVPLVALEGVLGLRRRFPLIAPDHVETGAIEGEMEASDPSEQLRDGRAATGLTTGRGVVCGHAGPLTVGREVSVEV